MKKGQVTIYIIIGLIIVIIASIFVALRSEIKGFFKPEIRPVTYYIEDCLQTTADTGITLLGLQGGYIELPEKLKFGDPLHPSYLPPPPSPIKVPMWWYKGDSYIPTRQQMQDELQLFIKDNIGNCLDLQQFEQQLTIEKIKDPLVNVMINDEDVSIDLDYPLNIFTKKDQTEITVDKFSKKIPSSLGKLHKFATDIMNFENENAFLEDLTMDMIAVSKGGKDSPYMPLEGYEFKCGEMEWSKRLELIPNLQNLVKYNFHFLRFDNSISNYEGEANPKIEIDTCQELNDAGTCKRSFKQSGNFLDYYKSFYNIDTNSQDQKKIRVSTIYDSDFGIDLDVEPSSGDKVQGIDLNIPLVGTCVKVFHHQYDIEYPLMFQLTDENGYQFNFATPVIIEKNQPKRYYSEFTTGDFTYSPNNDDYCIQSAFEKDVFVRDKVTREGIPNVNLRYECVRFGCDLGKTQTLIPGTIPFLKTLFPPCINGFLVASKKGYKEEKIQITVDETTSAESVPPIIMTPLKKLDTEVYVVDSGNIRPLSQNETAYILFSNQEADFEEGMFHPVNETLNESFELVYDDMSYTVDIKLLENQKPKGGLYLTNYTITRDQLSGAKQMRFYIMSSQKPFDNFQDFVKFWSETVIPGSKSYLPQLR